MIKKMFLTKHSPFRLAYIKLVKDKRGFNPFEKVKDFDKLIEVANQIRDAILLKGRRAADINSLYKDVVNFYE